MVILKLISMKNKLEKLEVVRGIIALYVVFHHSFFSESFIVFGKNLSFLFRFGQEAVILFFLMSGFVIGFSFERSRDKSFSSYFPRRFYRIYIPLVIIFLTHYLILSLQAHQWIYPQWLKLVGNILMLQDVSSLKPNVIVDAYLGNTPLWSLSYEWWFYMSFYLFYKLFGDKNSLNLFVPVLIIISAITYILYPFFLNRLFMYYGIWWCGVLMARNYLLYSEVKITDLKLPVITLVAASCILMLNAYIKKDTITTIGVSPILELRHFVFAVVVLFAAFLWQKLHWVGFNLLFDRFKIIAPLSYVLYISHYFLVARATFLDFIENKYIEFTIYLFLALAYSFIVETKIYPFFRDVFAGYYRVKIRFEITRYSR